MSFTLIRVVSVVLLTLTSMIGLVPVASPASANVAAPSWWQGTTCDTNNYPGSYALGASYDGVIACGPGPYNQGGSDHIVHFFSGAWGEYEWECEELVMRYMYLVYGIAPYSANGNTVVTNYSGNVLIKVSNNGSSLPTPGDIFSESSVHTGIVTNVNVTNGNGTITTMDQNATSNGWNSIRVQNGILQSGVTGWLHDPNGGNSNTPPVDTSSSNAGVVQTQSNSFTQVFAEGANSSLVDYFGTPGQAFQGPAPVAGTGTTYSEPSAVLLQSTQFTQVFIQGPSNSLIDYYGTPGQNWSTAVTVAGPGTTYSAPAAVIYQASGFTQVFAQGPNNSLITYWATPGQTAPWSSKVIDGPGTTYSAPAAVVNQSNDFTQAFVEGPSNSLNEYYTTPGVNWSGPAPVDGTGTTYSQPAAVFTNSNGLTQVFNEGPNNSLKSHWDFYTYTWQTGVPDIDGTGTTFSAPYAVVTQSSGNTQVFNEGPNNSLKSHWDIYGQTWGTSVVDGGMVAVSRPAAVVRQSDGFTQLLVQAPDNSLLNYYDNYQQSWGGPGIVAGAGTTFSAP